DNLNSDIDADSLVFQGTGSTNGIVWTCNTGTAPSKFLPANCR
ncbi:MAG: hypothetical protein ACJA1Z_002938, partial [Patiriisocius sp.]